MDLTVRRRPLSNRLRRTSWNYLAILIALVFSTGCQLSYYAHSAYHQAKLANSRKPITKIIDSKSTDDETRRKLKLVQEAKIFCETKLGLKKSSNYTSYVQLEEPYVSYIVQAAKAYQLEPHLWRFPFIGDVPYKGFFKKNLAQHEAETFDNSQFDTYVRGVTAYSTLGWFQDSVLSSMIRYEDHELVELIIHETVHTTLFIKSAAEFNERMATFLGHEGMKLFYLQKEGEDSRHLKRALEETHDQQLFSKFITTELKDLKKWYEQNTPNAEAKRSRLKEIQLRFDKQVRPVLKTNTYQEFEKRELNNAYLLAIQTYEFSLEDFAKLYAFFKQDFIQTMTWLKNLEKEQQPDQVLKEFLSRGI